MKLFSLLFGIVALLAISACAVAGTSPAQPEVAENVPTVIPTPTEQTETSSPGSASNPETTPVSEPDAASDDADAAESERAAGNDNADNAAEESRSPAEPVRIQIDRIGVDAGFEYVGVTSGGNMDVPRGWDNVAWYEPGTIPGAQGNSVIAGHYDAPGGGEAVFYHLNQLVPGDQIIILTADNEELVFEITEVEVVHEAEAPLKKIFGETDERNLNLITCEGVWDSSAGMYDQRLIVYSRLVSG